MPKGPQGQKRRADAIGATVNFARQFSAVFLGEIAVLGRSHGNGPASIVRRSKDENMGDDERRNAADRPPARTARACRPRSQTCCCWPWLLPCTTRENTLFWRGQCRC